ncbi:MAG TPA: T9SS type A sorting domain-containing protein, partial [Candidatus Enterocola sp.]|nr:T9SS type A sorting domain-containing protein [Candidatus Enterocola sp.]
SAYVFTKPPTGWVDMNETAKLTPSDGAGGDKFGYSVGISGNTIVVGAPYDADGVSESGSAYVFTMPVTGWVNMTQTAKLKPSSARVGAYFGQSVSISGDNIAVGAPFYKNGTIWTGNVFVYTKPVTGWVNMTQTAKLLSFDAADYDEFGGSVCMWEEFIVVGARHDDDYGNGSGAAYVFTKPLTGWANSSTCAKLKPADGAVEDYFGTSVAISGNTVVVGATEDDDNGSNSGSAYIFTKPLTGWTNMFQTAKIKSTVGVIGLKVGTSVCAFGDNILVGSFSYGNASNAYAFAKSFSDWHDTTETQLLQIPPNYGTENTCYGYSISIDSNYAVVGAIEPDYQKGAAFVLYYDGNTWINQATLTATDLLNNDRFGYSVGISGDNIVVGAVNNRNNGIITGSAYVFTKPLTGWANMTQTAKLIASDRAASDCFGSSVSISGDNIVVGALNEDNVLQNSGSAYVFTKPFTGWANMTQTAKITSSDPKNNGNFGNSISMSGDNIVVGSNGAAYIFSKPLTGWTNMTQTAKILSSDWQNDDQFGISVSISGDDIVVGANYDDDNGNYSGSAYIFTKPLTGWANMTQTAKIKPTPGGALYEFGKSVGISGNNIIVGAPNDAHNAYRAGAAYIFSKPASGWVDMTQTEILISDATNGDGFGYSASISGNHAGIGDYMDCANAAMSGSANLYKKCANVGVSQAGNTLSSNAANSSYQWLDCANSYTQINGETGQNFIPSANGLYAVEVTQDGCTDTSVCINFVIVGNYEIDDMNSLKLYPNPLTDKSFLEFIGNNSLIKSVRIFNILGKQVYYSEPVGKKKAELNRNDFASGLFIYELETMDGKYYTGKLSVE